MVCFLAVGARVLGSFETADGAGAIWRTVIQCRGTETGLAQCPVVQQATISNCGHDDDIGVSCQPANPGSCHSRHKMTGVMRAPEISRKRLFTIELRRLISQCLVPLSIHVNMASFTEVSARAPPIGIVEKISVSH